MVVIIILNFDLDMLLYQGRVVRKPVNVNPGLSVN